MLQTTKFNTIKLTTFDMRKYPNTVKYVDDNIMYNRRCNGCQSVVLRETHVEGFSYQCLDCDINMSKDLTYVGKPCTYNEKMGLYNRALDLLLLDPV